MAELADALDSGSSESNFMQVRPLLSAPKKTTLKKVVFFYPIRRIGMESVATQRYGITHSRVWNHRKVYGIAYLPTQSLSFFKNKLTFFNTSLALSKANAFKASSYPNIIYWLSSNPSLCLGI